MYETKDISKQSEPVGWFNNPINNWGSGTFSITGYTVVGYMDGQLWLQSKTGDSSDCIAINWHTDKLVFEHLMVGRKFDFDGKIEYDFSVQKHYIVWSNARETKVS